MVDSFPIEIGDTEARSTLAVLRALLGVRNETPLLAAAAAILDVVIRSDTHAETPPFGNRIAQQRGGAGCDRPVLSERGSVENSNRPNSRE